MPRSPRQPLAPGYYHLTTHGIRDEPIFLDDLDRIGLLRLFGDAEDDEHFRLRAYALMTTHYHALVQTRSGQISSRMKRLNGLHALRFNRAHGYRGHVFGGRFSATEIKDEWHLYETVRYIAMNPVRAGLCCRPEDWPWGSFAVATGTAPAPPFFDATWKLRLFSKDDEDARRQLARFVAYEPDYVRF
ncbi:MAG TPA: transposase [Gaiellaceae bacterium]|jgi:REP element-mobilizing transposase RayT